MPHYRGPRDGPRVITDKNLGKDFTKPVRNSKIYPTHGTRAAEKARKRVEKERRRREMHRQQFDEYMYRDFDPYAHEERDYELD